MSWHRIDAPIGLASGEKHLAVVGGREILVCRTGEDYYAIAGRCTHSAWPLVDEPIEGMEIVCTLHGARFDLRDGCPTAGPASKPLATYAIERRHDALYVSL
ncbi:MAG: Rieske 2Fe-2S domain-containing protein [Deltaproteobacteria bacterium]|jgi:3-phenylpropionate/trans-cinnamate dioxygenase ferredoxin subunit|nr:Rieske 2Fe-2S domain-containing protein [Deltaproteobacteria bacterium]